MLIMVVTKPQCLSNDYPDSPLLSRVAAQAKMPVGALIEDQGLGTFSVYVWRSSVVQLAEK